MDVYVKHFREKKVFIIGLQPDSTVLDLKNALADKYGVSVSRIKLIFKSLILKDDDQLVISIDFEENFPITCFIKPDASPNKSKQTSQLSSKTEQPIPHQPPPPTSYVSPENVNSKDIADQELLHHSQTPLQPIDQESEIEKHVLNEYNTLLKDPISSLCSYGFSQEDVEKALRLCGNNATWAQELLLSGDVSANGLQKLIQSFYPNYQTQVLGRQGDKLIVMVKNPNAHQVQRQEQETKEMLNNLMQLYNEMDETDKQNVKILMNEDIHICDAIYYYIQFDKNLEVARQHIIQAKQQLAQTQYGYVVYQ